MFEILDALAKQEDASERIRHSPSHRSAPVTAFYLSKNYAIFLHPSSTSAIRTTLYPILPQTAFF